MVIGWEIEGQMDWRYAGKIEACNLFFLIIIFSFIGARHQSTRTIISFYMH